MTEFEKDTIKVVGISALALVVIAYFIFIIL